MASSARIEELRKKFEENPRRYFAPLANEYRKAGDVKQAISICREYLPQQPGHMSGHIVYGQALYEARQFEDAKSVFETALTLDPENLIALRHLGDIALIVGDGESAKGWYRRVLEADPRNEEIQAQLARLDQAGAPAPSSAGSQPAQESPVTADSPTTEIRLESVLPAAGGGEQSSSGNAIVDIPTTGPADFAAGAAAALPDAAAAPTERLELDSVVPGVPTTETPAGGGFSLDGLETTSLAAPEEVAPEPVSATPALEGAPAVPAIELDAAPSDALPAASDALPAPTSLGQGEVTPSFSAQPGDAQPVELLDLSVAPPAIEPEPAVQEAVPVPESGPFVTETMAELYLQQGHREEALRVYRALLEQRPGDTSLQDKVASLQQQPELTAPSSSAGAPGAAEPLVPAARADSAAAPTIREVLSLVAMRRPGYRPSTKHNGSTPSEESASPNAPALGGDALAALLGGAAVGDADEYAARTLALAFVADGVAHAAGIAGAPARVATGELSLDAVFASGQPAPPSSFSFDQFFSKTQGTDASAGPETPGAESPEDVAQFTHWLQGLKQR